METPEGFEKFFEDDVDLYLQGENPLTTSQEEKSGTIYERFLLGKSDCVVVYYHRSDDVVTVKDFCIPSHVTMWAKFVSENVASELIIDIEDSREKTRETVQKTLYFGAVREGSEITVLEPEWEFMMVSEKDPHIILFVDLLGLPLRDILAV